MIGFLLGLLAGVAACLAALVWLAFQPASKWWKR